MGKRYVCGRCGGIQLIFAFYNRKKVLICKNCASMWDYDSVLHIESPDVEGDLCDSCIHTDTCQVPKIIDDMALNDGVVMSAEECQHYAEVKS